MVEPSLSKNARSTSRHGARMDVDGWMIGGKWKDSFWILLLSISDHFGTFMRCCCGSSKSHEVMDHSSVRVRSCRDRPECVHFPLCSRRQSSRCAGLGARAGKLLHRGGGYRPEAVAIGPGVRFSDAFVQVDREWRARISRGFAVYTQCISVPNASLEWPCGWFEPLWKCLPTACRPAFRRVETPLLRACRSTTNSQ